VRSQPLDATTALPYLVSSTGNLGEPTFYVPLLTQFLQAWAGMAITLTLDTSMLWDEYCLIEVCMTWGGRSFPLAQKVIKHLFGSVQNFVY
jgi:hypothetical protein